MPNKNEERENEKMAKKLKKVFALLLTLSMVMSLLSVTALAESNENSKWKIVSDIEKSGEIIIKDADGEEAENVWYWYDTADVNTALNKKGTARLDIIDAAVESPNEKKTYFAKATIDGQEVATDEFTVPYFAALQNGSFENPVVTKSNIGWPGVYQYKNDTVPELVWKTTGLGQGKMEGRDIELVRPEGKAVYHGVEPSDIPNGKQFAELNAEAYGALYQDVLTEPGSTLNWGLAHRGRNGQDTMYVVIVNAENAAYVTKPGDVNEDCIMARITDGNRKWGYYSGEYEVPAGQYVTRFYFLAVDAAGGMSQGNLLDNVYFTAERPGKPPVTVYDYTVNYFVDGKKVESFSGTASEGALIQTYDLAITQGYVSKYDASETNVYNMTISAEEANVLNLYFTTKAPVDPKPTPAAKLVVDKAAPATVKQGENLTYTITVENKGDATAKNVVIKDTLPEGVEFKSANNEGKMVDGTITWNIGELAAGEKKTVTVVVSVPSDATVGEIISNTAVVTSDDEEEPKEDTVKTEVKPKDDGKKDDDDDDDDDRKKPSDPGTDIGEDPTPLDPGPDVPGTEIPESDVPLAEVPKTGDAAALWMILAGVSALGLAVVTFTTRKKENN